MKTIIIACGSGVATSTIISTKVKELLEKKGVYYQLYMMANEIA